MLLTPALMAQGGSGSGSSTGGSATGGSTTSTGGTNGGSGTGSTGGTATGSGSTPAGPACAVATQQISLHIPNESITPGGVVQMKFMVTEPTPISSGGPRLSTPQGATVRGIQLFNPTGDVNGVAMINGSQVSINYITSTGAQGNDYPILTVALQIPAGTSPGTQMPFSLDRASIWGLGLLGTATLKPIPPATITVGGSLSITDVVPGGGLLPAGTVVSVLGLGFQQGTRVQVGGFNAGSITVASPNEIQIVLSQATDMSGKEIQVANPDGSLVSYFSYLRGTPLAQSNRPLLASAVPIFSSMTHSQAVFPSAGSTTPSQFSGVAVQSSNLTQTTVTFTLFSSANIPLGSSTVVIPSGFRLMQETSELVQGVVPPLASYLTVSSDQPVQVFGFLADDVARTVLPFVPLSSQP
jgi:hypothetical protein